MPGKKAGRKRPRDSGERADDEEEAFPRGGADLLTPLEKKQLEKQALRDVEAELHSDGVPSAGKAAGKRHKREAEEDSFVFKTAVVGKEQKYVELLKFKALNVGAKLWGVVQDITISELTVSLPHGLRGFVRPQQASDVLALMLDPNSKQGARLRRAHGGLKPLPTLMDLFRVGQFVRCSICELAGGEDDEQPRGRKRIGLSLLLSDLHDGLEPAALQPGLPLCACVSTVEDHGYTLALGIAGVQSFLSAADVQEHFGAEAHLLPGAMVECVVTEAKAGGRLVSLTCSPASVSSATITDGSGLSMQTLLPGFLVTARIRKLLSDGLLVSFLTYFHGTVDVFHLPHSSDPGNLAATFSVDQRLKARVVFVDASSKRVGLSLLSHLVRYHLPDSMPLLGEVHEQATVLRVDANLGVLLRLPTQPLPSLGYAHVSNVSDERLKSLAKAVKPGQTVAARVIGFRPLDGLATLTLKPSALQQQVVSYKDIVPGSVLSGTVAAVSDAGLMVALSSGIRAHVPAAHALELGNSKPIQSKFREGQPVTGRVLESDAAAKKAVMTLRKALVSSKLPIIASLQDAQQGARSHGIVTRVLDHGIVVRFYCGIRGLAAKSELGLSGGEAIADQFKLGQVVKAWVLRVVPDKQRLRLSLVGSTGARAAAGSDRLGGFSIRDVVQQAVVHRLVAEEEGGEDETAEGGPAAQLKEVVLHAEGAGGGSVELHLPAAHLSDHPTAAASLAAVLQPGMRLGPLVVVSRTKVLRVSCKASLLAVADSLPADVTEVAEGMLLPGYIASVTADSVFVRFMGELTARAGPAQLADGFLPDAQRHFAPGQSVRALVLQVEAEKGRVSVSLKPSAVGASAAQLARALLQDQQLAHRLQVEAGVEGVVPPEVWESDLPVGGPCSATVDAVKEYGVTCDLAANEELVGLVPTPHLPPAASVAGNKKRKPEGKRTAAAAALQPGQRVVACILDVSPVDGIVDLSLLPELVQAATAGGASRGGNVPAPQPGSAPRGAAARKLRAVVQQCKPDYLVVSLPDHHNAIGMLAVAGFNDPQQQVHQQFQVGQQLAGCLACEPCCGRLLLELPAKRAPQPPAQPKARRSKAAGALPAGAVVEATVLRVHPFHVDLEVAAPEPDAPPLKARACITDVADPPQLQTAERRSPLADLTKGAVVAAALLPQSATGRSHLHGTLELSLRSSVVEAAKAGEPPPAGLQWDELAAGQRLSGFVQKQEGCYTWLLFSRSIRGRAFVLPGSRGEAAALKQGRLVECTVVSVDAERHLLDVAIGTDANSGAGLKVGQVVAGLIVSSSARGVTVQLGPGRFGTVALTDLHDTFVDNALHLAKHGAVVQAAVLEEPPEQDKPVALSLRASRGGSNPCAAHADASSKPECPEELDVAQLQVGQEVHAYVKAVSKSGCFLLLARGLEARVKLRNLADGFVDDPAAEFPPGRHVQGWIVSLQGGMVEVSLKRSRREVPWQQLQGLNEGDIVTGRVRKLERYGAFVDLDNSALSGLVHVSEIADKRLKEPAAALQVGQRVRCRVLSVDLEARKLSLGTKPSYFAGEADEGGDGLTNGWEQDLDNLMADLDGGGDDVGEDVEGEDADLEERMLNAMDDDEEEEEEEEEEEDSEGEEKAGLRIGWDEEEGEEEEEEDEGGGGAGEGLGMDESGESEHELLSEEPDELGGDEEADSDDGEEEAEEPGCDDVEQLGRHSFDEEQEEDDDGEEEEEEEEEDEEEEETERTVNTAGRAGAGAGWQQLSLAEEEAAADDEQEGGVASKKLSKAEKKRLKKEREEAVRRAEAAKIDGIQQPETVQHFQQLLRASPDSSLLWIKYMAHLIGVGEVGQARAVAERALQSIGYREEQEKLNVWIAWLNLESVYGEPEPVEALMALFHRALQYTDQKKLYLTMLGILQRINKDEQAQQVLKAMTRKFRTSCKIWLANLEWLVKQGRSRDAQATLDRALKSLDKRKHLKLISSMARLEFRIGSTERGRGLLDNVLRNYPKRLDIWNQYLDQELKQGDIPRIRALFDRVTHLLLPARKLKHFFKRYLQFEMEHGDAAAVQRVKDHALEVARSVT